MSLAPAKKILWLVPCMLMSCAVTGLSDSINVTKFGSPAQYEPLDQSQAQHEVDTLGDPSNTNPATLAASQAVSHGAHVSVLSSHHPPTDTLPDDNFAVPRTKTTLGVCADESSGGTYFLNADVSSTYDCLTFHDATSMVLDCQGHHITTTSGSGVVIQNVSNFEMRNCNIQGNQARFFDITRGGDAVFVANSANVTIKNSDLSYIYVTDSENIHIDNNHITQGYYQNQSSLARITNNHLDHLRQSAAGIFLWGGDHNQVINNLIEGGWNGDVGQRWSSTGASLGISLVDQDHDVIQGNTIQDTFFMGMEIGRTLSNSVISGNSITGAGLTGIGSDWDTNWTNNTISHNIVSGAASMMTVLYYDTPEENTYPLLSFKDNRIENNEFHGSTNVPLPLGGGVIPVIIMELHYTPEEFPTLVGNNSVANNDFGTSYMPPSLTPSQAFVTGPGTTPSSVAAHDTPSRLFNYRNPLFPASVAR